MRRLSETNWLDCFIQRRIPLTCPPCNQHAWNHSVNALKLANRCLLLNAVKALQHTFSEHLQPRANEARDRAANPTSREREGLLKVKEPNCSICKYSAELFLSSVLPSFLSSLPPRRDSHSRTSTHSSFCHPYSVSSSDSIGHLHKENKQLQR